MGEYCKQDVLVNMKLWSAISETFNEDAHELEDRFDNIIRRQEKEGVTFDEDAAKRLHAELIGEKAEMEATLQEIFPPQEEPMKTPQYYYHKVTKQKYKRKKDYTNKDTFNLIAGPLKVRKIPFNPGSRLQIANALKAMYGWQPTELTGDGRPRVDEAVLSSLDYPEAKILTRYLTIIKRLGQLSDGKRGLRLSVMARFMAESTPSAPYLQDAPTPDPTLVKYHLLDLFGEKSAEPCSPLPMVKSWSAAICLVWNCDALLTI